MISDFTKGTVPIIITFDNTDNKINRFVMVFAFAPTPLTDL